jgi:hypothetical protein
MHPRDLLLANGAVAKGEAAAAILGSLLGDELAAWDAARCADYSLAFPAGDGIVYVHRAGSSRHPLNGHEADQWKQTTAGCSLPTPASRPHGRRARSGSLTFGVPGTVQYRCLECGAIPRYSGGYAAARGPVRADHRCASQQWDFGSEHPDTLTAQANLANSTTEARDLAAARGQ